jgi:hypothetical protein
MKPLEKILEMELAVLNDPKYVKYVKVLSSLLHQVNAKSSIRDVVDAYKKLFSKINGGSFASSQLTTKSKGYWLLSHMYVVHIMSYDLAIPELLNHNLMILKSEYLFNDRFQFLYDDWFPFLHPAGQKLSKPYSIVPRGNASDLLGSVENSKTGHYLKESLISDKLKSTLTAWFKQLPVEPYLYRYILLLLYY